jgi:hypothetical protein
MSGPQPEPVQASTYLACGLLAETLSHMADNFSQPVASKGR